MKKSLTILSIAILLVACNNSTKKSADQNENLKTYSLSELVASAEKHKGESVSVSGMVSHVCKHGGQKMFLSDSAMEINLKVVVTESIPEFDIALEGSNVEVIGKLVATDMTKIEEEMHEGDESSEGMATAAKEECVTEAAAASSGSEDACVANIVYHIEAASFKEIL